MTFKYSDELLWKVCENLNIAGTGKCYRCPKKWECNERASEAIDAVIDATGVCLPDEMLRKE